MKTSWSCRRTDKIVRWKKSRIANPNSSWWPNNLQRNPHGSLKGWKTIPTLGAQLTNLTTIKLSRTANHLCIVCVVRFIQSSYLPPIPTQVWLTSFHGLLRRSWFAVRGWGDELLPRKSNTTENKRMTFNETFPNGRENGNKEFENKIIHFTHYKIY